MVILGKHEDFVFEGIKKNSKSSEDKKLKNIEKTLLPFDKSKKHKKFVARFIILLIAFVLIVSIFSIGKNGISFKAFGKQKSIKQLKDETHLDTALLATCSNFDGFDKQQCMLFASITQAITKNDISLCNKNADCEDAFYFDKAENNNDPEICGNIKDSNDKIYCREAVVVSDPEQAVGKELNATEHPINELDFSGCNGMNEISAANCRDNIVIAKALSSKDVTYCQAAEDKLLCHGFYYRQQALIYNDKSLCNKILHAQLKEECLG